MHKSGLSIVQAIVPSSVEPDRAYVMLYPYGWYQLDDAGSRWTHVDFPVYNELVLDSQDAEWLYGISRYSSDGGRTWQEWPSWPGTSCRLVAHPTQTRVLFARCEQGLFRSTNVGETWEQLAADSGALLVPDHSIPGRLAWVRGGAIWVSCDDGTTWAPIAFGCGQ